MIAQRLSQVDGVAEVTVNGAEQPAIRVRVNPGRARLDGAGLEDVRTAIANANAAGPLGVFDGAERAITIGTNDQLRTVPDYDPIVVRSANGTVVRLSAVASIELGVRNSRSAGWFNGQPSVLLVITKQANANVIETVDRIYELLPELKRWIPADIDISVLSDRTQTIRASVHDMQLTLLATVVLVMLVVFLFLRRAAATIAAGVTVPLSLAGTCAAMWVAGFSIDNLSLMALAVSVGFVVDDAIVMIENCFRNLEKGMTPFRAAIEGARQIGFTVLSISISLVAAFIPLLFMSGVVGRVFREFSVTLTFAIAISTVVSLTLTPMICAHFVRKPPSPDATWLDRAVERVLGRDGALLCAKPRRRARPPRADAAGHGRHHRAHRHALRQDAEGLLPAGRHRPDLRRHPGLARHLVPGDERPAAEGRKPSCCPIPRSPNVGSSVGTSGFNASVNNGRLFISLKPLAERGACHSQAVINRLRPKTADIPGLRVFMFPTQDVRAGGRQSDSSYQFTLWDPDYDELLQWAPRVLAKIQTLPELVDVTTDREQGGLQANVVDRPGRGLAARRARAGHRQRAQQRLLAAADLDDLHPAQPVSRHPRDRSAVPARSLRSRPHLCQRRRQHPGARSSRDQDRARALAARHQPPGSVSRRSPSPSTSARTCRSSRRRGSIDQAVAELHLPDTLHAEFAGDAQAYRHSIGAQPMVILAALIAIYIVLGVLYESLAHPLTIISTLPSAGLGALLALQIFSAELSLIAFIGIILLIGIVKKNGIMMVDFALEAERERGLAAGAGDPRGLPRALPPDHDDDPGGAARRGAADHRDRPGLGTAPAARHDHRRRPAGVAGAHALHDAGDLSAARPAAPVGCGAPASIASPGIDCDRGAGTTAVVPLVMRARPAHPSSSRE